MVEHQSKEVVDKMSEDLKVQPALALPRNISNSIQPVFNVNPDRISNIIRGAVTTSFSAAIYTTPTDRDFYLVALTLSVSKNGTSTSTTSSINFTIDGAAQSAIVIAGLTATAQSESNTINFPFPIKLDRGTQILISNGAAGNINTAGAIIGYTTDPL